MLRDFFRDVYAKVWRIPRFRRYYSGLSVQETFRHIYRTKVWGDNGEAFFSGTGSLGPVSEHYCTSVTELIRARNVTSVVDLGCGDFAVGRQILAANQVRYTGVDVVPELIEHHQSAYRAPGIDFVCADITSDPLPDADLCLLRQVLQHLSNAEIASTLRNLSHYPLILISEEIPQFEGIPNHDKTHGPDVRCYYGSGVFVEHPPFSLPATELWRVPLSPYSLLRTVLVDRAAGVICPAPEPIAQAG